MRIDLAKMSERLRAYGNEEWRIPQPDLNAVLFFFAVNILFLSWLALSVFGVEANVVKAARQVLPEWFFLANLFASPFFAALAAGPLPIGRLLRVISFILLMGSGSLGIVTREHQGMGLVLLGFFYFEVFWIIPQWNKWSQRRQAVGSTAQVNGTLTLEGVTDRSPQLKATLKTRLLNLLMYIGIALAIATLLIIHVLRRP